VKGDTRLKWEAIELSKDHVTENLEERKRLLESHPDEEDVIRDGRVKGSLQPTRGIGDGLFKDPNFNEGPIPLLLRCTKFITHLEWERNEQR